MTSLYRVNYQLRSHKRDGFIEFIKAMLLSPFVLRPQALFVTHDSLTQEEKDEVKIDCEKYKTTLGGIEDLVEEHKQHCINGMERYSRLHQLVPGIGKMFSSLPLVEAFDHYDRKWAISARHFVPPSFNDIRHILNVAQILAIAPSLKLITFDGDMTLYDDGQDFEHDSKLVHLIISLLQHGLYVAIVTAAGYPRDPKRYEERLSGLLKGFEMSGLDKSIFSRFFVLGGECNYLFQYNEPSHLRYIDENEYLHDDLAAWSKRDDLIQELLDIAQKSLQERIQSMNLPATLYRKERAVGLIRNPPNSHLTREQLDECVLATQQRLRDHQTKHFENIFIPFCAFNGGSDAWVDIGNKLIGVQVLQHYLQTNPEETLHVGDQFLSTGNDFATRSACCTAWITSPAETSDLLEELTSLLK